MTLAQRGSVVVGTACVVGISRGLLGRQDCLQPSYATVPQSSTGEPQILCGFP